MYYKKLKQGIIAAKSVRKSSVVERKQVVLTERTENQKLTSQRRSYDVLKKAKNLNSENSSVNSADKENISVNTARNQPKYKLNNKDASIRRLMKDRELLIKVNIPY